MQVRHQSRFQIQFEAVADAFTVTFRCGSMVLTSTPMTRAHTLELIAAIGPRNLCGIWKDAKPLGYDELACLISDAKKFRHSRN